MDGHSFSTVLGDTISIQGVEMHFSAPLAVYYTSDKWREALEFEESGTYIYIYFALSVIWKSRRLNTPQLVLSENQMYMRCPYRV